MAPARKLARINSSKMQASYKFVCKQSSCVMKRNHNRENLHARTTDKKRDVAKVMLIFSAPLQEKVTGVSSQHDGACVLGMPMSTLATREKALIGKRWQLSTIKKGISECLLNAKRGTPKSMRQSG